MSLATVDDVLVEGPENFTVSLSSAAGVSGSPVTTTINDNDLMALKLSGTSSVVEGGTASYDVKPRRGGADGGAVGDDDAGLGLRARRRKWPTLPSWSRAAGGGSGLKPERGEQHGRCDGAVTFTVTNTGPVTGGGRDAGEREPGDGGRRAGRRARELHGEPERAAG